MRVPMLIALGAVVVMSACEKRSAPPAGAADSTAVADSAARDSMVADTTKLGAKAPAMSARDSIIGHDSAFGPIGAIDSTGKVVPIRQKRP